METIQTAELLAKLGYDKLNPMQTAAVASGLLSPGSFLVSAPTASGKTLLALLKIASAHRNGKTLYIVPLKALAAEKHEEFSRVLASFNLSVGLATGDLDYTGDELAAFDVIISTSEKADSLLRHGAPWTKKIALAVIDELHLIDDSYRGATLEVVITKLKETGAEILGLSATIPNAPEIAEWLEAKYFESTYRPTLLEKLVACEDKLYSEEGAEPLSSKPLEDLVTKALAENKKKGQAIVFVSSRRSTEKVAEDLAKITRKHLTPEEQAECAKLAAKALKALPTPTQQCKHLSSCLENGVAFHHAGLVAKDRALIEEGFKRSRCIKVIVATTTLAMGVDFPASWVIVRDVRRFDGGYSVHLPNLEVQQMCLPEDAEILAADGSYRRIGELVENKQDAGIASVNESSWKIEADQPVAWIKNEADYFVKIRFQDGREIKLTPNHPLLKLNEFLKKPFWKRADAIDAGDFIAVLSNTIASNSVPHTLDYFEDVYIPAAAPLVKTLVRQVGATYPELAAELKLPVKTLKAYAYNKAIPLNLLRRLYSRAGCEARIYSEVKSVKTHGGKIMAIPERLSPDFLWLVGIIAAEGSLVEYTGKGRWSGVHYKKLKISNTDPRIIEKVVSSLGRLGITPHKYSGIKGFGKKEIIMLEICNQSLARLIMPFGMTAGKKSHTIAPSDELFRLHKDFVAQYVAGVFDGDGSFGGHNRDVRLCVKSRSLVLGMQRLLKKFDIRSTARQDKAGSWWLSISAASEIAKFKRQIPCVRLNIQPRKYVRETRPQKRLGDLIFERVAAVKTERLSSPQSVYNLTVRNNANYVYNDVLVHNCGRAGRPRFDRKGVAVIMCSHRDLSTVRDKYILGPLEHIYSKLSAEPSLRMHSLALVASGHAKSLEELNAFFSKTFYAKQYGDLTQLYGKIEGMTMQLQDMGFLAEKDGRLFASPIGRRTSELYLDPLTAHAIIKRIKQPPSTALSPEFALLLEYGNAVESRPLPRVGKHEEQALWDEVYATLGDAALTDWELDREALEKWKNAKMINAWINEATEDEILKTFDLPPGIIHARMRIVEWLTYATAELAMVLNAATARSQARRLQRRVKHGVKDELLDLVAVRGIGRARGRKLYDAGITTREELQASDKAKLAGILGERVAGRLSEHY